MERLDQVVARVLANVRVTMEERAGEARSLPGKGARDEGGPRAPALAMGEDHPRISSRRMAKKATGLDAKIIMKR